MSSGSPSDGSVFATGITVRETVQRQTFSPSTPAAIDISRQTYAELITDDPQLSKKQPSSLVFKGETPQTNAIPALRILGVYAQPQNLAAKTPNQGYPVRFHPPTQLHNTAKVQMSSGSPSDGSVFATGITVRETVQRQTFSPSTPAAIDISRQTYAELITDDPQLSKVLLPEYLDYYTTALIWMRIVHLKQRNSQALTIAEQDLLTLVQTTSFCVPEPLNLQVRQLGNVVTATKQHLYPEFPPLPEVVIYDRSGYYGVTSEAVCQAISDAPPGRYASVLDIDPIHPVNENLLGFRPLGARRAEAKNLAFSNGIAENAFPAYPVNTGFCFEFLQAVSSALASTRTFKNTDIVFSTLAEAGAQSQTVISRPITQANRPNIRGERRPTSLTQEQPAVHGSAIFFDSQLKKEPGPNNNHATWCCINFLPGEQIPVA
ncbi:unnamed protein product [Phaedon cochleariae]|uniref:Uncharacterized protein n=1 Tax=Phaedon cochleariae TaxID=80249 RepID=A0A9N9SHA2_PHACE|nr:unnamed protein product [Phaedon cochleariae]